MPAGRPPKPQTLVDLAGDPSNRRKNCVEPASLAGTPECPEHLDEIARAKWSDITALLSDMQLLSRSDAGALELYCTSYSRYRTALDKIATEGEYVSSPNGFPMISPWSTLVNQMHDQLKKLEIEFGLTPAARSRMRIQTTKKSDDKISDLLKVYKETNSERA